MTTIGRWALLVAAAALGLAVGTVGGFEHRGTATVFGVPWPTGLVFAFCGLVGLLLALDALGGPATVRTWRPTRLSVVGSAAAGWLIALMWLTYFGPPPSAARKGDVVLANDWRSLLYLIGGMAVVTAAVYRAWTAALAERLARLSGASRPGSPDPKG